MKLPKRRASNEVEKTVPTSVCHGAEKSSQVSSRTEKFIFSSIRGKLTVKTITRMESPESLID